MATLRDLINHIDASLRFGSPLTRDALIQIRGVLGGLELSRRPAPEEAAPPRETEPVS